MTPLRVQRIMMSIILIAGLLLDLNGFEWGEYLIWFVALMSLFAGITGFCPSDKILMKITGKDKFC
ncbi:MAG: YgaP-like transmembrane domain [Hydrogenothermaceae bacterium]